MMSSAGAAHRGEVAAKAHRMAVYNILFWEMVKKSQKLQGQRELFFELLQNNSRWPFAVTAVNLAG